MEMKESEGQDQVNGEAVASGRLGQRGRAAKIRGMPNHCHRRRLAVASAHSRFRSKPCPQPWHTAHPTSCLQTTTKGTHKHKSTTMFKGGQANPYDEIVGTHPSIALPRSVLHERG